MFARFFLRKYLFFQTRYGLEDSIPDTMHLEAPENITILFVFNNYFGIFIFIDFFENVLFRYEK